MLNQIFVCSFRNRLRPVITLFIGIYFLGCSPIRAPPKRVPLSFLILFNFQGPLCGLSSRQLIYYIRLSSFCQELFSDFLSFSLFDVRAFLSGKAYLLYQIRSHLSRTFLRFFSDICHKLACL